MSAGTIRRLHATAVSKRYGAVQALDAVDFEVLPGEVMALLGENGAGKSSIVKVISGLIEPDSGSIQIDGEVANIDTSARSQAAGIAVVQQEYSTIGCLTVAENLLFGDNGAKLIWRPKELARRARPLLDEVGLSHVRPDSLVEDLSVAEMQLLEIARILSRDAKIIIFDEPTAALSEVEIARVLDLVRRLAARGISIIYVTHRLPEVFAIADRATIFRNGRSLPPIDVQTTTIGEIIELMLGRELEELYPERASELGDVAIEINELHASGLRVPVTLQARRGEILGLTGQLGSGASAVVRALAGEDPIVGGEVKIGGVTTADLRRKRGLAMGIAYCSSDRKKDGMFPGMSIVRNLSSPWLRSISRFGVISTRREREGAETIADSFSIDVSRLTSLVATLSGGNQQKVALSKWLGGRPSLLLVEEPTRGVDVGARSDIYAKLRALCESGMTIIVASSDTAEIYGLCDTIATFYHGELTDIRSHDQWTEDAVVNGIMSRRTA